MVARIVKENFPGLEVSTPRRWSHPFIFCSPHSGRDYPRKLIGLTPLPLETLRRSEDAYVDQLIPPLAYDMVPVLKARFPRLFVDVNRSPRELDPMLFAGPLDDVADTMTSRVAAGFGVIPKLAADGRSIYPSRLPSSEAKARLKQCFTPYHNQLASLVAQGRDAFGRILIVDWHSMPSSAGGQRKLDDIVLGDVYGASCESDDRDVWEQAFLAEGFSVARNKPYAGGYVAKHYGRPQDGIGVLQIEINRALYMDERRVARRRDFPDFAQRIKHVIERVGLASTPWAVAAE